MIQILKHFFCVLIVLLTLSGCDQTVRHKALTTLFDGVPDLPPVDRLCEEYVEQSVADQGESSDGPKASAAASTDQSVHQPYGDKNCAGCHKSGGSNALLAPVPGLCLGCHSGFIQGKAVHGPVAVGDCLACHVPHQSNYASLLVANRTEICGKCHKEKRLASNLHAQVKRRGLICVDCHGAHFGNSQYFLN